MPLVTYHFHKGGELSKDLGVIMPLVTYHFHKGGELCKYIGLSHYY